MKNLSVYRPFRDNWSLADEVNKFFWGLGNLGGEEGERFPANWAPAVDVLESEEALKIHAELPGLKKEDIKIDVQDNVLTLQGEKKFEKAEQKKGNYYRMERSYGMFARSFSLPDTVNADKIEATMKDGVLELTLPKKPEAKPKRVNVEIH